MTDGGVASHFVGRTACHDAACIHNGDAVGNAPHQVEVVLDQHKTLAILITQLAQEVAELLALIGRQARRRFIQQQYVGLLQCHAHHFQQATLAVRHPIRAAVAQRLAQAAQRLGGRMSGGEQQMLTVARTLMGNPFLVLLDEPSEGVAPVIVEQMVQMILELKTQGVSILLSEQNMHFAELVSDRAYVLEKGQLRFEGSMSELAANETVRRDYLSV